MSITEQPENEKIKKPSNKKFWVGLSIPTLIFIILYGFYFYASKKDAKREREAKAAYEQNHAKFVADSLAEVNKNKAEYYDMVNYIHRRDSLRNLLRYKIGDIVYLKPDSMRCVIFDISSDSTMNAYNYIMISNNKNIEPGIIIRSDKLLY